MTQDAIAVGESRGITEYCRIVEVPLMVACGERLSPSGVCRFCRKPADTAGTNADSAKDACASFSPSCDASWRTAAPSPALMMLSRVFMGYLLKELKSTTGRAGARARESSSVERAILPQTNTGSLLRAVLTG
jgi:hypothetical protein